MSATDVEYAPISPFCPSTLTIHGRYPPGSGSFENGDRLGSAADSCKITDANVTYVPLCLRIQMIPVPSRNRCLSTVEFQCCVSGSDTKPKNCRAGVMEKTIPGCTKTPEAPLSTNGTPFCSDANVFSYDRPSCMLKSLP